MPAPAASSPYHVGVLYGAPTLRSALAWQAFESGLRDLGYVEGRNLVLDYRSGTLDQQQDLAAKLVANQPDVIFANNTASALALRRATASIPIVVVFAGDLVGLGLIDSVARPGGNVTGREAPSVAVDSKRLQLLADLFPGLGCVTVLTNLGNPGILRLDRGLSDAARALSLTLNRLDAHNADDLRRVLATAIDPRCHAVLSIGDSMLAQHRADIATWALARHLAVIGWYAQDAADGFLMSYGVDAVSEYRLAGGYVDKILKGAKPADLPVEFPTHFGLTINLKTARALGIDIPAPLLSSADEVIE